MINFIVRLLKVFTGEKQKLEWYKLSQNEDLTEWEIHEQIIERFIQGIAKNMSLYGITTSIGRLYGVLYFSEVPMTLDDMTEALKMSKTSMSTGIRTLSEMRMVESTFRKGVRKDLYEAEEDWYKSFTTLFGKRWRSHTEKNTEEAERAIQVLKDLLGTVEDEQLEEKIKKDIDRLEYAKNYYKWLLRFIEVTESGKIFDYIPKEE